MFIQFNVLNVKPKPFTDALCPASRRHLHRLSPLGAIRTPRQQGRVIAGQISWVHGMSPRALWPAHAFRARDHGALASVHAHLLETCAENGACQPPPVVNAIQEGDRNPIQERNAHNTEIKVNVSSLRLTLALCVGIWALKCLLKDSRYHSGRLSQRLRPRI